MTQKYRRWRQPSKVSPARFARFRARFGTKSHSRPESAPTTRPYPRVHSHPTHFALLWSQRHFIARMLNPYIADTSTRHPLTMQQISSKRMNQRRARVLVAIALFCALSGCSRFRPHPSDKYVYVTSKQTYLRDRVAAVSNRTGTATNGEQLVVLDHARRWVKVRTPSGEIGWIEERLTAPQDLADKFDALRKDHQNDPVVATATTSDDAYLHVAPGRLTDKLYLLTQNGTLSLLQRASVAKPVTAGAQPQASADPNAPPAGPIYEDWWLVRDAKGQTGWVYSRLLEVSAPDSLLRYAEGQRIVGAYILTHVDDPASGILDNGNTVTSIPVYVTVLSPYKAGLPFDFNQVRVFTWNTKKHRYETGFSEHNIVGYLPVKLGATKDPYGKGALAGLMLPAFTYRVLAANQPIPTPDPTTGLIKPGRTIAKTYRLEGNNCHRILPPGTQPEPEAHPQPDLAKPGSKAAKRAAHKATHQAAKPAKH
jgi:SH3-like domain-containing protein